MERFDEDENLTPDEDHDFLAYHPNRARPSQTKPFGQNHVSAGCWNDLNRDYQMEDHKQGQMK